MPALLKRRRREVQREQVKAELAQHRRFAKPGRQLTCDQAAELYLKVRDRYVVDIGGWTHRGDAVDYGDTPLIAWDPQEKLGWLTAHWGSRLEDEYRRYRRMTFEEFVAFFDIQLVA